MASSQLNISNPKPIYNRRANGQSTSRSVQSSGMNDLKTTLISKIQSNRGLFKGEIQWCSNISLNDWKTHYLEINSSGGLCHSVSQENVAGLSATTARTETFDKPIIKHLQSCKLQLIDDTKNMWPIIRIETYYTTVYLRVERRDAFLDLFTALIFWTSLKDRGIFNKCSVIQPIFAEQQEPMNLLVCQFNVYSTIPRNRNVSLINNGTRPFSSEGLAANEEMGWYSAMGKLNSNGKLDLLLQSDGSLLWTFDISELLRSEIQIMDPSILYNDTFLYLGIVPKLRQQLRLSTNCSFQSCSSKDKHSPTTIVLQFPLRIDLEDWFVALKTFAKEEKVSLIGTDKSNELRISNRFKISILEADFSAVNLTNYDNHTRKEVSTELYATISIWDHCWARTSIVTDSKSPFWREEFDFNFSVKTSPVCIAVKIAVNGRKEYSDEDKVLGVIEITQEMINDGSLSAETRVPIFDIENKHFQLGTLCIKVTSSLNAILPSINFSKLESMLCRVNLTKMTDYLYDLSIAEYLKLEDLSVVFLDIFQSLDRTNDWFQALIEKELSNLDLSVSKNTIKNLSSANIYSSLFRGNSILTKSIERYFNCVGQEYLEKAMGPIIQKVVVSGVCLELDPSRIKEKDAQLKDEILEENYSQFLNLGEELWSRIYHTSNDLPNGIKEQLKVFRKNLEGFYKSDELKSTLNCVSGFLFLRFFCPVILNPKLFHLVTNHPDEGPKRTLTLLAKVLLNLSNLTLFGKKEPWMTKMNDFILKHGGELTDYIEKVTDKKLDFSTKTLRLSDSLARPKIVLNHSYRSELPTNPYLIDKHLRETELITVLAISNGHRDEGVRLPSSLSMNGLSKEHCSSMPSPKIGQNIGELEFEKLTENNAEIFGEDLMKYLAIEPYDSSTGKEKSSSKAKESDLTKTLEQESILLYYRLKHLTDVLSDYEYPNEIFLGKTEFALYLVENLYLDKESNVRLDLSGTFAKNDGLKKLHANLFLSANEPNGSYNQRSSGDLSHSASLNQIPKSKSKGSNALSSRKTKGETNGENKTSFKLLRLFRK
ncbi:LADA_0G10902g1_1 [Lachancea dasiensis]|uniref:LADA_0G10902g1_1 n=1 Tax=Lachancea dasiensis TaxID=1072105 RepID=A0A1G4JUS9_9SACH|nr:LADA_0G10902g1_1 [Lachancea dasiensis]